MSSRLFDDATRSNRADQPADQMIAGESADLILAAI
jgi:hypothetical protein